MQHPNVTNHRNSRGSYSLRTASHAGSRRYLHSGLTHPNPRQTSPRLRTNNAPMNVSQASIYQFLGNAIDTSTAMYVPQNISKIRPTYTNDIDIEHICNGVVHPVTGETIIKYKTLSTDPATQKLRKRAMSLELGRLALGFMHKKGTNMIRFLTHDLILNIASY